MPIIYGKDTKGKYVKWGKFGKKYYYTNQENLEKAKEKAYKQANAIEANKRQDATQKEREQITKNLIKILNPNNKKPNKFKSLINFPHVLENEYARKIRVLIKPMFDLTRKFIFPNITNLKKRYLRETRLDAYSDDVFNIIFSLRQLSDQEITEIKIEEISNQYARFTEDYNYNQLDRDFKNNIGINPIQSEPYLASLRTAFVLQNVNLIKTAKRDYFKNISIEVINGVENGLTTKEIKKRLRSRFSATEARLNLIARDQVGKYFGQLTRVRSRIAGIKEFRWRTAGDERVRSEHRERNGKIYTWKNGANGEFPGTPIQCRCVAENIYSNLF